MQFADRLRLHQLRCLVTVAETRHIGRAADRLNLSQPAVSKALTALEDAVGQRLVSRGRLGARLTPAGERFLPHAVAVFAALARASTSLGPRSGDESSTVRVGSLPTVAPDLLPRAIVELNAHRPARVTLHTAPNAPLMDALRNGSIDLAVGRISDPAAMAGLTFELLYLEPLALVVRPGHPLTTGPGTPPASSVAEFPLVVAARNTAPRHNTESWLDTHGISEPVICLETLSVSAARLLVQRSDAVWIAPTGAVREDVGRGALVRLPIPTDGTQEPVGLLRRRDDALPEVVDDFVSVLRRIAATREES